MSDELKAAIQALVDAATAEGAEEVRRDIGARDEPMQPLYDATAAARSRVEALCRPQWQPIETAPKDGTHILLSDGANVSVGGWVSDVDQGAEYEGQAGLATWWSLNSGPCWTHWQPLPPPPGAAPPAPAQTAQREALSDQKADI